MAEENTSKRSLGELKDFELDRLLVACEAIIKADDGTSLWEEKVKNARILRGQIRAEFYKRSNYSFN